MHIILIVLFIIIILLVYGYFDNRAKEKEKSEEELYEFQKINDDIEKAEAYNLKIQKMYNEDELEYNPSRKIKAIVGDYNERSASITNSTLKKIGIVTEIVPYAHNIIDKIKNGEKYDVIITNHIYPNGESGEEILFTLKNINDFKTPIIILTVDQNARKEYVDEIGFDEYIPKLLDIDKAIKTLPKVISELKFIKVKKQ